MTDLKPNQLLNKEGIGKPIYCLKYSKRKGKKAKMVEKANSPV